MSGLTITTMTAAERDRATNPDPEAGLGALVTSRGNLPLELLDLRAHLTGLAGTVALTQGFTNPYEQPIEATYVFPLPDRFAVTGMKMTAGDRTVEAVLAERGAARAEYDRAVAEGKRASIAEEERPDVFTMRVGNIPPGERVSVELTLAGPLSYEDEAATFRFPLVVAPRYIPGIPLSGAPAGDGYAADTAEVPDASRITPPVLLPGFPNPVRLSISVRLDTGGLPLELVRCSLPTEPIEPIETDGPGEGGMIRVVPGQRIDRDFILRLRYGQPTDISPGLVVSPDAAGPEGTFQLTVLPPAGTGVPRQRDVVLLLDRSGSMYGWKMVAARRAAARIVDTLTETDRFAVLTFDSVVERPANLPAGLVPATDRHRFRAVEHLARAQARGGTEMLQPLREALDLLTGPAHGPTHGDEDGRDRVLVLVTDGQVGNEDQILRETVPALERVRVHTVGIDQAVNAGFLGRLAAFGGGRCELVESEDRLDEAMDHIHRRIAAPLVTGLTVRAETAQAGAVASGAVAAGTAAAEGGEVGGFELLPGTLSPARRPDLFPGAPVVFTGRFRGSAATAALVVSGQDRDGQPWQVRVPASTVEGDAVRSTWARAHLRDLADRYATSDTAGDLGGLEQHIVETSLRFGVLCRFTAYVAVDSRVVTEGGEPHRVIQPVEAPAGWGMLPGPPATVPGGPITLAAMSTSLTMEGAEFSASRRFNARPAVRGRVAGGRVAESPVASPSAASAPPAAPASPVVSAPAAASSALGDLHDLAKLELRRLAAAAEWSAFDRRQSLDDLATRLTALLAELPSHGTSPATLEAVRSLVEAIRVGQESLDELWAQAIRVLELLASSPGTSRRSRGLFWKR